MQMVKLFLCCWIWVVCTTYTLAQNSVLAEGRWIKIAISKPGVYAITPAQLRSAGINPDGVNPKKIKVFGNPGGMLPQSNASARPVDLTEKNIWVTGEEDGVLNIGDRIIFYADGPDEVKYDANADFLNYTQNLYTRQNFCFLTVDGKDGKRINTAANPEASITYTTFTDVHHYESSLYNLVRSGRTWLGERMANGNSFTYTISWSGIAGDAPAKVKVSVANAANSVATFTTKINGTESLVQNVTGIGTGRYDFKFVPSTNTRASTGTTLGLTSAASQQITVSYTQSGGSSGSGYIDYITLNAKRTLSVYGTQTIFRVPESRLQNAVSYSLTSLPAGTTVWDVTETGQEKIHVLQNNSFSALPEGSVKTYIAFSAFESPVSLNQIPNQNIRSTTPPALAIVTHADFLNDAQRLQTHRNASGEITSTVFLQEQIFNEFSGGRPDVTAIRDFARHMHKTSPTGFHYLLLFGKGTFDYLNVLKKNNNKVLTYESRNSFAPLETYSSDDYFALLGDTEGVWNECFGCDETLDIGVGRFSVTTPAEAKAIVDKIIEYETNTTKRGLWQSRITFVADDGNIDDGFSMRHQRDANDLADLVETTSGTVFTSEKIFIGSYPKVIRPSGQTAPAVTVALKNALEEGTLVMNYVGHGNEFLWADERVLDEQLLVDTRNETLPFLVTATCEFGRHDDPDITSVAELFHHRERYGAIGLVTTSRPVFSQSNFELNTSFYEAFLARNAGSFQRLGDIFKQTKNNSTSGVSNRNFSLLGDPSMKLNFPELPIEITEVKSNTSATKIEAFSTVTISGRVTTPDGNSTAENFNGIAEVIVFDKAQVFRTLPNPVNTITYPQWSNRIFSGKASVKNGEFSVSFVTPGTINYTNGNGRIHVFASSENQTAAGVSAVVVGGSGLAEKDENNGPIMEVFMHDTTFINGGLVSPNTRLFAKVSDENGINISGFGIGNDLIAILDGEEIFELKNYYQAKTDTYKHGIIDFPLKNLAEGPHTIEVMAWDVFGNPGKASVSFTVTNKNEFIVTEAGCFPNPSNGNTSIFVRHNAAGEALAAQVTLYSANGTSYQIASSIKENVLTQSTLITLEAEDLPAGMYYARILLRSLSTSRSTEATAKLVIVK
ncbi:MAG: type IX secretion system sortase PorU [Cyclobacteriaceae bacterium]|nr:type IX secretion system sortase PorU [Cytophagales bacterium]MCZ8328760.1 type IX secretion system sortase PorU [Cyclobacteriaceae bacterium]